MDSNELHPLKDESIFIRNDKSRFERSIDFIFFVLISSSELKKLSKLIKGIDKYIWILFSSELIFNFSVGVFSFPSIVM